ncbi:hypothetical protein PR048_016715 [Dryococelus australis]|uniref:Uncharacterized protein n=1 Tax=Dryococelus australis TaxID=614101 RepID=A0ABQ9H7F3_9NEOP|nr:hypothetical protein PR048_016715 [Dryococelus australis]
MAGRVRVLTTRGGLCAHTRPLPSHHTDLGWGVGGDNAAEASLRLPAVRGPRFGESATVAPARPGPAQLAFSAIIIYSLARLCHGSQHSTSEKLAVTIELRVLWTHWFPECRHKTKDKVNRSRWLCTTNLCVPTLNCFSANTSSENGKVWILGTAVAELLACSPPTNKSRVRLPARSLPDICMWESYHTMRVFSGISRFPRPFIPALLHTHLNRLHRFSRPR